GREVILASAADERLVAQLAADHGLSADIVASDGVTNMKGARTAAALVAAWGEKGFDYAGNEPADRAIWRHAENALVVGPLDRIADRMTQAGQNVALYPGGWRGRDLIRALRPHQWVKNVLLLVPMLAAHVLAGDVALSVIL